ncbi:hypothetical protein A2524_01580 [Candidatus Wolfebacteria bacterium RIFOXYD12_FULL_48_21]|uniref:DUF2178 domain-containing protein n=1 Tax=Candidatus Wolfebacteria bacterium RIFOXYD1_FULL_48_65 TaxID=1802561 RepID=A0A1F8DZK8_9BACT|nr:MAG: hypothetical protein A2610_03555 [Candidatus Wolfebacteria bacterium RIFOXYD1_FULL_48_65]OGM94492.1 MAG: hypothetical protein A2524_01580 [Candidatus Wolfebacteria bacterium RIFOXYD12_FULL_48_21]OGM96678.1 MAG: hypothetical protein A2532_03930 [Candidatus Wolfebacteria bacterium RIFOXYD2_FULL_48_11]
MTAKRFQQIKLVFVVLIAMIVGQSIVRNEYLVPLIALVISALVLMYLRRKVTEVVTDERDHAIGGKAAFLSIQIYSWIAVVIMLVLFGLRASNPAYEPIATTLAYSTCALMLIYSGSFRYLCGRCDK